jgi:hypothetical protein
MAHQLEQLEQRMRRRETELTQAINDTKTSAKVLFIHTAVHMICRYIAHSVSTQMERSRLQAIHEQVCLRLQHLITFITYKPIYNSLLLSSYAVHEFLNLRIIHRLESLLVVLL